MPSMKFVIYAHSRSDRILVIQNSMESETAGRIGTDFFSWAV